MSQFDLRPPDEAQRARITAGLTAAERQVLLEHGGPDMLIAHPAGPRPLGALLPDAFGPDGPIDETLRRDLTWQPDSAIIEWEYGDVGAELVRISETEADQLTDAFRSSWAQSA